MATKIRRTRARRGEGERLRDEILDATEQLLLATNDIDSVSIRAVAEAVGVTSPSIYMHFARKEELLLEVCERRFSELGRVTEQAVQGIDDPVEVVKAMGRAYVRFGLERPEQYRFLFMERTPEWAIDHMDRIADVSGFGRLIAAVQRCIDEHRFKQDDAFLVACALWTGVHGVTSLLISQATFPWPDRDRLIDFCIDTTCVSLAS